MIDSYPERGGGGGGYVAHAQCIAALCVGMRSESITVLIMLCYFVQERFRYH